MEFHEAWKPTQSFESNSLSNIIKIQKVEYFSPPHTSKVEYFSPPLLGLQKAGGLLQNCGYLTRNNWMPKKMRKGNIEYY